jgi:hypothetical protein
LASPSHDEPDDAKRKGKTEAQRRELKVLHRKMAERMGALPLAGDQPRPGSNFESAAAGAFTHRKDRVVSIEGVVFQHPGQGLPAFAEWLCRQAAGEIRYGYEAMEDKAPDEGDQEP